MDVNRHETKDARTVKDARRAHLLFKGDLFLTSRSVPPEKKDVLALAGPVPQDDTRTKGFQKRQISKETVKKLEPGPSLSEISVLGAWSGDSLAETQTLAGHQHRQAGMQPVTQPVGQSVSQVKQPRGSARC